MEIFELSLNIRPFELFNRINPEEGWMFFDSSLHGVPYSNYSIIAVRPNLILSYKNNVIKIKNEINKEFITENPFDILREKLNELRRGFDLKNSLPETFTAGFAGFISYDYGMKLENVESKNSSNIDLPEIFFSFFDSVLVYNHSTKKYSAYSKHSPKEFLDFIFRRLTMPIHFTTEKEKISLKSNFTSEEYIETIKKIKKYIEAGEVYQINFSHQFITETRKHPLEIYSKLREKNPAQFSALICVNSNTWILSSSPELFLDLKEKKVITKPIKGTIKRGKNQEEDEKLQYTLFNSEKDSAELLMIVDLERNDLGKVCEAGSIKVNALKKIETYASVHHLVAEIEGKLKNGYDIFDLIKATFPGGSITGAPKKRAMEIIDELEKVKRNIYTGSIGYIDVSGNAMFNIAIRTLIYQNGKLFLNLGGGIVYDSDAEKEYEETLHKGKAIFESLLD